MTSPGFGRICHRRIVTCHSSDFSAPFLFIYRLSEPKQIEKWSTFIKINEESFSNLKKRFVIDGYGGFQDKIFHLASSTRGLNHRIFRMAGFLQSAPKMSGKFIKIFCSARMEKNTSLSVSFNRFFKPSVCERSSLFQKFVQTTITI